MYISSSYSHVEHLQFDLTKFSWKIAKDKFLNMHLKLLIVLALASYASAGWYGPWTNWGACSVTCGTTYSGTKERTRYVYQLKY